MRWVGLAVVFIVLVTGACIVNGTEADGGRGTMREARLDGGQPAAVQLTPRIKARLLKSEEPGVYPVRFERGSWRLSEEYLRGATAYWCKESDSVFVVQEFLASDSDRIILYDWAVNPPVRVVLDHPDANGYFHTHYEVLGCDRGSLRIRETQYAGDDPPRCREVLLEMVGRRHGVRNGKWAAISE